MCKYEYIDIYIYIYMYISVYLLNEDREWSEEALAALNNASHVIHTNHKADGIDIEQE